MKAKILETFQSIQGEGIYAGVKQIFVRFFECNMHCSWCDTPNSIGDTVRHYDEYTLEELLKRIDGFDKGAHSISLTGGEPMLQKNFIKALLPELRKRRVKSYLETNGIFYNELGDIINELDIVAMDIKLPSSTQCKEYWREHEAFLRVAKTKDVFIKTVISSGTDKKDIEQAVALVKDVDPKISFILQPNSFELKNGVMKRCLEFHDYALNHLSDVRILPQIHRQMKLR